MSNQCSYKSCFGEWNVRNCLRKGKVQREGEWYCKQHDPVAVKAKQDAEKAKYQAQHKRQKEDYARRQALEKLANGIETKDLHKYRLMD